MEIMECSNTYLENEGTATLQIVTNYVPGETA